MRWTKTLSKKKRTALAKETLNQRRKQLEGFRLDYSAARDLKRIDKGLLDFLKFKVAESKKPVRFLDAGAGLMGVSADLKKIFGDKIDVTAITLRHPNLSKKSEAISLDKAIATAPAEFGVNPTYRRQYLERGREIFDRLKPAIEQGRKNAKIVDHAKVGLIENMSSKNKFDVILDYVGALRHGVNRGRILDRYCKMLPKGGTLVCHIASLKEFNIANPKKFRMKIVGNYFFMTKI
jgi:hypothetical protein